MRLTIALTFAAAALILLMGADLAQASPACSVAEARRDVREARRAYREAVRVYDATRTYSARYGAPVGRWVRLSRRTGWPWTQMPTLMYVIRRESGGRADVFNYEGSGCAGLLQLAPVHYSGRFDPTNPRANLKYGLKLWRASGWAPWAL